MICGDVMCGEATGETNEAGSTQEQKKERRQKKAEREREKSNLIRNGSSVRSK
jgi:hypothetical protein